MAASKTVWGIDIGQCALKALKLREVDGQLQAEAFDIIEHPKILSQPDADRPALIRQALEQFLARNDMTNSLIALAVPGQSSFTRFVKLPPVEAKRIGDIVRFEAEQQIPFDINEVIWRWQSFHDPDSPDVEVGIFAIKRGDVYGMLSPFQEMLVGVDFVQMAPLALFNFMTYDQQVAADGATLLVDIGADNTNLVVADGPRLWTRTIQLGGNNFTESLVKTFKLSFSKAEKLKRTAATSKYARQIFQAMRPVFADLVQEIQRSIGYYTSLHRETRFKKVLGLGNGFRLPGLQKFLEQNLNLTVVRIDGYNALQPSPAVSAPQFTENVLSFAVAYGLALQGLGLTRIETNLLPEEISTSRQWASKRPWFAAAAGILLAALAGAVVKRSIDRRELHEESPNFRSAQVIQSELEGLRRQYQALEAEGQQQQQQRADAVLAMTGYRTFWPNLLDVISKSIRSKLGDDQLRMAFEGSSKEIAKGGQRQATYLVCESFTSTYEPDLQLARKAGSASSSLMPMMPAPDAGLPPTDGGMSAEAQGPAERGFKIVMKGYCPMSGSDLLNKLVLDSKTMALQKPYKDQFEIVEATVPIFMKKGQQTGSSTGLMPSYDLPPAVAGMTAGTAPVLETDITGRTQEDYWAFELVWFVKIVGDGITPPAAPAEMP